MYEAYLERYAEGAFAPLAKARLDELRPEENYQEADGSVTVPPAPARTWAGSSASIARSSARMVARAATR